MSKLEEQLKETIRDIPDFPKPGILFKDIMPIMAKPQLCRDIVAAICEDIAALKPDKIVAVESRGFLFGPMVASQLDIPFVPIRKVGKLPGDTIQHHYDLEYGSATIEMHRDTIKQNDRIVIHDDLLATGGTAAAAAELVQMLNGNVIGFSFLVNLSMLNGAELLQSYCSRISYLVNY